MPETDIKEEEDLEWLFNFNDSLRPECDNEGCTREAVLIIKCPCQQGYEFSCKPCVALLMMNFPGILTFDANKACGHTVSIYECGIDSL